MRRLLLLALAGIALMCSVPGPAFAQATRTWVSGVGDDANPCSRTAPCKTFAGAISKTSTNGEINCLDPGGFGALTITKSITVLCQIGTAGVLVSGTNGIVVSLPAGGRATLDGLDIEGLNSGLNGVNMIGQGLLIIRNSTIRDFTQAGVAVVGPAGTPAPRVVVQNSLLTNNGVANPGTNPNGGIYVQGQNGATNNAEVLNSLIDTNTNTGITVNGTNNLVLAGSTVTGQSTAISVSNGGAVISYGNNVIRNTGTPTQTVPLQ